MTTTMNVTPSPIAYAALRRVANHSMLLKEDGDEWFFQVMESVSLDDLQTAIDQIKRENPPCSCGAMSMLEAEEKEHHCNQHVITLEPTSEAYRRRAGDR
jgi:hypothetical protein